MFVSKLAALFCVLYCVALSFGENLKVSLYYESLCPYSKEFVANQLYPGYQVLGDSLVLELVPYGKSKSRKVHDKWQITCQHGPKECLGNKIQACVVGQNYTQTETVNFVGCIMGTDNPEQFVNARKCAQKNKLSWKTIKACVNGDEGNELIAQFGEKTNSLEPKLQHVPYILFKDVYDEDIENSARDNFLKTACELFQEKPNGCQ